jgi:hypothetical protein
MSLVSTASLWTNDDQPKKRTPALNRKTIKTRPANSPESEQLNEYAIFNLEEAQQTADERTNRVTEIINKMTAVSVDNDGAKLADFTPPPNPEVQQKKPADTNLGNSYSHSIEERVPLMESKTFSSQPINPYATPAPTQANYRQAYDAKPLMTPGENKPYYASMGIGAGGDGKLLEKINYMIHMLENMEAEKTANITEEFVLYSFTGIFIIFVLDTFLKTGKYVR